MMSFLGYLFELVETAWTKTIYFFVRRYNQPALEHEMKTEIEKYLPPVIAKIMMPMLYYTMDFDLSQELRLGTVCYARKWNYHSQGIMMDIRAEAGDIASNKFFPGAIPCDETRTMILLQNERSRSIAKKWYVYRIRDANNQIKFFISFNMPGDHYGKDFYEVQSLLVHGNGQLLRTGWALASL